MSEAALRDAARFKDCLSGTPEENSACQSSCTLDTCPLGYSYWNYRPNVPINGIFGGLALLLCLVILIQGLRSRQFKMYTIMCFIGSAMETIGYVARIYAYYYPFSNVSFISQLSCLTFAPAFFAAAIYFSLSRIVLVIGPTNSRLKAKFIPRIFITCDVISLLLQGAGGGISAWRASHQLPPDPGNYTLIAGLSFQSLTLLIFVFLSVDFALRTRRRVKKYGDSVLNDDLAAKRIRNSKLFKWLIYSLALSAILIFERSIYRIAELSQGWKGDLMAEEKFVVIWESVPIAIASILLCALHPGLCFRQTKSRNSGLPTREECYRMESTTNSGISSYSMQKGGADTKAMEIMYDDENSSRGSKRYTPPDHNAHEFSLREQPGHNRY